MDLANDNQSDAAGEVDPVAHAWRLRRERDRRTKKLLIVGLFIVFFLYCAFWYLLTRGSADDPVFQLRRFYEQFTGGGDSGDDELPFPPTLATMRRILAQKDRPVFDRASEDLKRGDARRAGRDLWPLAAAYPDLRPSIAREYYDQARMLKLQKPQEALKLVQMALAFHGRGIRENGLAAELYAAINQAEPARDHQQLSAKYFAAWKKRRLSPPTWYVSFFLFFLLALIGTAAYYYWEELALVERLHLLITKLQEKRKAVAAGVAAFGEASAAAQKPQSFDLHPTGSPGDTLPGGGTIPAEKGSITNILQAEGFLKEVQDFFDQKNYELAVDLCQKAVELNPANGHKVAQLCLKEGVSLYDLGDFDQAIDLLDVSLHYNSHLVQAHLCLGNCFIKMGQYDKAQKHYEAVISITPQNTDAYYTLGVCYQRANDIPKAKRSFEVAVKLKDHANSHFYLAKICEAENDLDGAIQHWRKFIELAPDNPQAASARKRLEALQAQRGGAAGGAAAGGDAG